MTLERSVHSGSVFRWVDTPWTVAAALGIWGAMIGIERFTAADVAASVAAIFAAIRLGKETLIWSRRRHSLPFATGLIFIVALIVGDFYGTSRLKASADSRNAQLAQLDQIPQLQRTIQTMTANEQATATSQAVAQGRLEQRVSDIGTDNKGLKASIEQKDAALAKIALEQYALNFTPQILIVAEDSTDHFFLSNNGKTNVEVHDLYCDVFGAMSPNDPTRSAIVTPNSRQNYTIKPEGQTLIVANVSRYLDGKVPVECHVNITTLDKKNYLLTFVWLFVVKDNVVSKSYTTTQSLAEVK